MKKNEFYCLTLEELKNSVTTKELEEIRTTLRKDGEILRTLKDELKAENLPVVKQNEIRKQIIDLFCKDLMITSKLC